MMQKKMVDNKDENKKCIVLVREKQTGKLVWKNFNFCIERVYENGTVLVRNAGGTTVFHRSEVIAINI